LVGRHQVLETAADDDEDYDKEMKVLLDMEVKLRLLDLEGVELPESASGSTTAHTLQLLLLLTQAQSHVLLVRGPGSVCRGTYY